MIQKIKTRIRRKESGWWHDSKADVSALAKVCTELIGKVNELTDEVNALKSKKD